MKVSVFLSHPAFPGEPYVVSLTAADIRTLTKELATVKGRSTRWLIRTLNETVREMQADYIAQHGRPTKRQIAKMNRIPPPPPLQF